MITYKVTVEAGTELFTEVIVVPLASITATDRDHIVYYGPMNSWSTSFEIPSDQKEEFDRKLRETVPEAASLQIKYDDNGYAQVMQSLETQRLSMRLLLAGSVAAVLAVLVMITCFFVVRERKRTAIERSLGLSGRQCVASLLAGILILAATGASLGSAAGWALFSGDALSVSSASEAEPSAEEEFNAAGTIPLSREFSLWARNTASEDDLELSEADVRSQKVIFFAVPILMLVVLTALLIFSIRKSLKIDPLLLLGEKGG